MIYLTLGDLVVRSPEQGHPQRVHVHLWGKKKHHLSYISSIIFHSILVTKTFYKNKQQGKSKAIVSTF